MAKVVDDVVLDGALNIIKNNAIRMAVCTTQPANYAGIAALTLATATMAPADMIVANGDTSGRKLTMAAKSGVTITGAGTQTAGHVVLHDNAAVMHYVTTCNAQSLTNGGTVNIPAWKIEIADPT
jgi:hypothetical protein